LILFRVALAFCCAVLIMVVAATARPPSKPLSLPMHEQTLWWACYALKHDVKRYDVAITLMQGIITNKSEQRAFIGLCSGA
jgi:hypothetical protein